VSKKKQRDWITPLEEAQQEAVDFAQGVCMSLNVLKLIQQIEQLKEQGIEIDETYETNLIAALVGDIPTGEA